MVDIQPEEGHYQPNKGIIYTICTLAWWKSASNRANDWILKFDEARIRQRRSSSERIEIATVGLMGVGGM